MIQAAFVVGFRNFACLRSFAGNVKGSQIVGLGCFRLTAMGGSKRLRSKSSAAAAASSSPGVKLGEHDERETVVNGSGGQKEIHKIDSDEVEKMTVQQLRDKLKGVGIPTKGSKNELVSAWKKYLNCQIDGSLGIADHISSPKMPIESNLERNAGGFCATENVSNQKPVSASVGGKRTKRKVKEVLAEDVNVGMNEMQSIKQKEPSVEYSELKGKKSIQNKGKASLEVSYTSVEESQSLHSSGEPWTVLSPPPNSHPPFTSTTDPSTSATDPILAELRALRYLEHGLKMVMPHDLREEFEADRILFGLPSDDEDNDSAALNFPPNSDSSFSFNSTNFVPDDGRSPP